MNALKNFTVKELRCPATEEAVFNKGFLSALQELRDAYGKPMIVNSCARSKQYNESIGGAPNSYHLYEGANDNRTGALAIDIAVTNGYERFDLIQCAIERGWSVGVYSNFIHLDRRVDLGAGRLVFWGKY